MIAPIRIAEGNDAIGKRIGPNRDPLGDSQILTRLQDHRLTVFPDDMEVEQIALQGIAAHLHQYRSPKVRGDTTKQGFPALGIRRPMDPRRLGQIFSRESGWRLAAPITKGTIGRCPEINQSTPGPRNNRLQPITPYYRATPLFSACASELSRETQSAVQHAIPTSIWAWNQAPTVALVTVKRLAWPQPTQVPENVCRQ